MNAKLAWTRIAGALGLAAALTSTAATAQSSSVDRRLSALGYSKAEIVDVVPDQVITSWGYLDNHSVLVHRDESRHYLVTLNQSCPALQSSSLIRFNAAIAGLGSNRTLQVGSGPNASECAMNHIIRLDRAPA